MLSSIRDAIEAFAGGASMTRRVVIAIISIAVGALANSSPARMVFLRNSELFTIDGDGENLHQLTEDQIGKRFPMWAPSGERIAYLAYPEHDPEEAFAHVCIIDKGGKPLKDIAFRPKSYGFWVGMRFVEQMRWISNDRILLSGSMNPSAVENTILDADTGKEITSCFCDGSSLSLSPDGRHSACLGLIPHFTQFEGRDENLEIDGKRVFPAPQKRVQILSRQPVWSDGSDAVVVVAQAEQETLAVIWRSNSGVKTYQWPADIPAYASTDWRGKTFYILGGGRAIYWLNEEKGEFLPISPSSPMPAGLESKQSQVPEYNAKQIANKLGWFPDEFDVWPKR
jgi:hypothetical protein